jgi:hypothetical protein
MKYLSIDIETSGLSSDNHKILSIGVIVEDTSNKLPFKDIPKFHCAILHEEITGSIFALSMNKNLIGLINKHQTAKTQEDKDALSIGEDIFFLKEEEVCEKLWNFLFINEILDQSYYEVNKTFNSTLTQIIYPDIKNAKVSHITCAGKNFGTFDKLFLEKLPRWKQLFKIRQRIIDPTILFTDWKNDNDLPNLTTCKTRAKTGKKVTHNAIEDAFDVIELMRTQY